MTDRRFVLTVLLVAATFLCGFFLGKIAGERYERATQSQEALCQK